MTKKNVKLPECGLLLPEDFESEAAWRRAHYALAVQLIEEVGRLLRKYDEAEELADRLNRVFAPFNFYDFRDGAANFVVAVPTRRLRGRDSQEGVQFQFFYRGQINIHDPDDYREISRRGGKLWYDSDEKLTEEDIEAVADYSEEDLQEIYEEVAAQCLEMVYWADPEGL